MLVAINHETIEYTLNSFIITTTVNKHTFYNHYYRGKLSHFAYLPRINSKPPYVK